MMILGAVEPIPAMVEQSEGADVQTLEQFQYIQTSATPVDQALQDSKGCACTGCCGNTCDPACSCFSECSRGLQALQAKGRVAGLVVLLECGPACNCCSSCPSRPSQQGVTLPLTLCWSTHKGWCVRTSAPIPQGRFVCEYAGEYVSGSEAELRLVVYDQQERGHALLKVCVQLPSCTSSLKCCIDATRKGNVARFINHSCDGGNLEPVVVSMKGNLLPRVALFAARDIAAGEELSFQYAAASSSAACGSSRRCFCGAATCTGYLPKA